MNPPGLRSRIRTTRSRATVLKWEARQATHSRGVWYRLRRLLTFSREAWAVDDATIAALIASGFAIAPEGEQIDPPKRIVVLPPSQRDRVIHGRPLLLGLHRELFAERNLVLILWDEEA